MEATSPYRSLACLTVFFQETDEVVGIPHCLEQDDVYDGYFIPAGATIHALEWQVLRKSWLNSC
jgi:hypothetical protein